MGPLQGVVVNLALGYVVGAVKQYGASVNWQQLKTQANTALQHAIPWHFVEVEAESVVDGLIDAAADVLGDEASVKAALSAVANKDWQGEVVVLKGLLAKEWKPEGAEAQKLLAALQAA